MKVDFSARPLKTLRRMPRDTAIRIRARIDALARDPHAAKHDVVKLIGRPGYRLRVGDWRVIYDVDGDTLHVRVIAPRGGVYR